MDKRKLTLEIMKEAVLRSGYLIERRVSKHFQSSEYSVILNQIIIDPISDKPREVDFVAIHSTYNTPTKDIKGYEIICECENNPDPIVFFPQEYKLHRYLNELRYYGLNGLRHILKKKNHRDRFEFLKPIVSSQYCTFKEVKDPKNPKNKKWIAYHSDQAHGTFDKLKKSVQHRRKTFGKNLETEKLHCRVFYPILVLNDYIYIWDETEENNLKPVNHVKLIVQDFNKFTNFYEHFYIDVIKESFVEKFLEEKQLEWQTIKTIIKQNRNEIILNNQKDKKGNNT